MSALAFLGPLQTARLNALVPPTAEQRYAAVLFRGSLTPELSEIKTRLEKHVKDSGLTVIVLNDGGTPYLSLDGFGCGADTIREKFKTEIEKGQISFVATSPSGSGHFAPYN